MSLEDQIRRMGDARADEVTTPAWRGHLGMDRSRGRWTVAAAAVLALAVGGAVLFDGEDAVDTETADGPGAPSTSIEPKPLTTTTDPLPTDDPPARSGICAANPVPSDEVLDIAAHIAFDRTPLDLDQDGIDDEMLVYDDAGGNWLLLARLQTGWTNAVDLGRPARADLMNTPEGVPAATDLDGDGGLEFFVGGYGNTARTSEMVSLASCTLRVVEDRSDPSETPLGWILHGVGGNSCAPTGCFPRVRCIDDELVLDLVEPADEWRGIGDADPADVVMVQKTETFAFVDGYLVAGESIAAEYPFPALPAEAPGPDDSDVIGCSP